MPVIDRAPRAFRLFVLAAASLGALAGVAPMLAACESATNLDVDYGDSGAALQGDGGVQGADGGAGDGGEGGTAAVPSFSACPCDESAGFGCCVGQPGQPSYCTTDTSLCAGERGMHLRCGHPDPSTESVCCWHLGPAAKGAGAVAAYASACDGGVPACSENGDCAGTGKTCMTATCNGVPIGACADAPPSCPLPP